MGSNSATWESWIGYRPCDSAQKDAHRSANLGAEPVHVSANTATRAADKVADKDFQAVKLFIHERMLK